MAKTKKMAFGGMGSMAAGMGASRPPVNSAPPVGSSLGAKLKQTTQPTGAVGTMGVPNYAKPYMAQAQPSGESGPPQSVMQKMAQAQPRGALGGNQPPAGANLMQKFNGSPSAPPMQSRMQQMQQMQPRGALGGNQPPAGANLTQAYQAQPGQPSAPPTARSLAGMGAFMKKGGAVKSKAYAKGGSVSSASKRGDGIAQRGKTKGKMV